jgi:hypothetical protein
VLGKKRCQDVPGLDVAEERHDGLRIAS